MNKNISLRVYAVVTTIVLLISVIGISVLSYDHKMHGLQLPPDESGYGWTVSSYAYGSIEMCAIYIADDWNCTETGNVTNITLWGAWYDDDEYNITHFYIEIWSNTPAGETHSMPNEELWNGTFAIENISVTPENQYTYGWYQPDTMGGHWIEPGLGGNYSRFEITDIPAPFYQEEGNIYWLAVIAIVDEDAYSEWGWTTTNETYYGEAVVQYGRDVGTWYNLSSQGLDEVLNMAFVICNEPVPEAPVEIPETPLYVNQSFDDGTPGWGVTHFNNITSAVAVCTNSSIGYTIIIDPNGTTAYSENIVLDETYNDTKYLNIVGNYSHPEQARVAGTSSTKSTFEVMLPYVNITNLYITNAVGGANSYHGVSGGFQSGVLQTISYLNVNDCYVTSVGTGVGIFLRSPNYCLIYNNTIYNCPQGISATPGGATTGNVFYGNSISGASTTYGIYCYLTGGYTIHSNTITGCSTHGIYLYNTANNCIVYSNNISNCGDYGLKVSFSSGNTIYWNNFINNKANGDQVYVGTTAYANTWNLSYPYGGNYYSHGFVKTDEYMGPNQDIPGSDNICDSYYEMPVESSNNRDYYPFMTAFNGTFPDFYEPQLPTGFTAVADGRHKIDLNWTKGTNSDNTYIEYHSLEEVPPSWNIGDQTFLYNNTGVETSLSGLIPGTTYYFKAWGWNATSGESGAFSISGETTYETTDSNLVPVFSNPNPANNSINQILSLIWNITIEDPEGDTFNWTIGCSNGQTNSSNDDTNGSKNLSVSGLVSETEYTVWVNATDEYGGETREWFLFNTRDSYIPVKPSVFEATAVSVSQIDLNWTKGDKADTTYIEWNTTETWTRGNGTEIYNNTGESCSHTSLSNYTQYFYQAWSYNSTDNVYSALYSSANNTTHSGPPNTPTEPSPEHEDTDIDVYRIVFSCLVTDYDGHTLNVTFYFDGNPIGIDFNVTNNTRAELVYDIPLGLNFNHTYEWYVNVTNPYNYTVGPTWNFTTILEDMSGTVSPLSYYYGLLSLNEEKISTSVTVTNTGNSITDIRIKDSGEMISTSTLYSWNLSSIPDKDKYTVSVYVNGSWFNITDSFQTVYTGLKPGASFTYRVKLHTPTSSNNSNLYTEVMTGTLTVLFTNGETDSVNFKYSCAGGKVDEFLTIITTDYFKYIEKGVLSSHMFYLSVPTNMTEDTEIQIPKTYTASHWVFWTKLDTVRTITIYGIDSNWKFTSVEYTGRITDKIKLNIDDIDDYLAFCIIPNPGYFQTSEWWFGVLNNARSSFVTGESLS